MQEPIIIKTSDYSIFKTVGFNRDKNKKHIRGIKNILEKENLLHLHPILVNNKMEVIDGQHRLEAARELGLEIFYIQSDISYDHILNSNLIQKKMSLCDVIKFYSVKDKIEDYIRLRDYLMTLEISAKSLIGLIFGSASPVIIDHLKSGKFKMPKETEVIDKIIMSYMNFSGFCKSKRITPFSMIANFNFTIAYRNLILLTKFSESIFLAKLEMRWFDLKPKINSKEWTRQLINIYNWKNQSPIEFPREEEN